MTQPAYPLRVTLSEPHLITVTCAARHSPYLPGHGRTACDARYDAQTIQTERPPTAPITCWRCNRRIAEETR
ncbi:hypothetical protein [Streptomyces filamentosus]|uniref:hypothetical protein n=1 Tax=Streptomyces filamentosus TaxID=67294 RepID=UPI001238FCB5|nr:hypothetical protein [Streptomyces filamentosus]KAA6211760.1 hypothetical protein CP979_35910 [Streptomyces filamentosus]KAA6220028.1 hypothetical protein CP979_26385 [Streptomyces filamentosus]